MIPRFYQPKARFCQNLQWVTTAEIRYHPLGPNLGFCVTVKETGETLVLDEWMPNLKKGFFLHKAGKVGKTKVSPAWMT